MNNLEKNFATVRAWLLGTVLLALMANLLTFCKKSDETLPQEYPDPANDLIGFYNPFDQTLYVLNGYEGSVMSLTGAEFLEGDIYAMPNFTVSGASVTSKVMVKPIDKTGLSEIYLSYQPILEKEEIINGTSVLLFKNAYCGASDIDWPPAPNPSHCERLPGNQSKQTFWNEVRKRCKYSSRAEDKCLEYFQEIGQTVTYDSPNCNNNTVISRESVKGFVCRN